MSALADWLHPVQDRLSAHKAALGLAAVQEAVELEAAGEMLRASPAAFLMPVATGVVSTRIWVGATEQVLRYSFAVLVGFQQAGPAGAPVLDRLQRIDAGLINLFTAWRHPDADSETVFLGAQLADFDAKQRQLWWQSGFAFTARVLVRDGGNT